MNLVQFVLPEASEYEKKCQRIDHEILSRTAGVSVSLEVAASVSAFAASLRNRPADLAHVYGDASRRTALLRMPMPWISTRNPPPPRFLFGRQNNQPTAAGPLTDPPLPEAVEEHFFAVEGQSSSPKTGDRYTIGSYGIGRPGVKSLIERTVSRLERFREDLDWKAFDRPPAREDLETLHLWVDPATSDEDYDGFTAEAIVGGMRVVASRTAINRQRLLNGSGFAVPVNDPNELAHAILTALFKDEIAAERQQAAIAHSGRFHPSTRALALLGIYNRILHG